MFFCFFFLNKGIFAIVMWQLDDSYFTIFGEVRNRDYCEVQITHCYCLGWTIVWIELLQEFVRAWSVSLPHCVLCFNYCTKPEYMYLNKTQKILTTRNQDVNMTWLAAKVVIPIVLAMWKLLVWTAILLLGTLGKGSRVPVFSAVCWLYGRHLYETLNYPIGLIASSYGGTLDEAWSSPDALHKCGIHSNDAVRYVSTITIN